MKKYLLVLVGLCCVLSYALAERPDYPELKKSDANIIGHVLDKKTKEHLPYITIALKGTTIGTVTDATGHYFLKNLPEGNFPFIFLTGRKKNGNDNTGSKTTGQRQLSDHRHP